MNTRYYFQTTEDAPDVMWLSRLSLQKIDPIELQFKINRFKHLNFQKMSIKDIKHELRNILTVKYAPGMETISLHLRYKILLEKNHFFRIRNFKDKDELLAEMQHEESYWNPHIKYVKNYGRLNKPRESLLYVAEEPLVALQEKNVQEGDWFVQIIYTNISPIRVWALEPKYDHISRFDEEQNILRILEMLNRFLVELFTMDVPLGKEYLYRITECIVDEWFATSYTEWGWSYPSVKDASMYNLCLDPKCFKDCGGLRNVVKFSGAFVCRKETEDYISIHKVIREFDKNRYAIFEDYDLRPNSDMKDVFKSLWESISL